MTFAIIFHVIFQKIYLNEMDFDVSNLNEIDKELKVEININIFGSNCNFW